VKVGIRALAESVRSRRIKTSFARLQCEKGKEKHKKKKYAEKAIGGTTAVNIDKSCDWTEQPPPKIEKKIKELTQQNEQTEHEKVSDYACNDIFADDGYARVCGLQHNRGDRNGYRN